MKRAFLVLAIAALAHADTPIPSPIETLTAIDAVPTKDQLFLVFGTNTVSDLAGYALDTSTMNAGPRLRAIHALAQYCTAPCGDQDPAHVPLIQIVNANATATAGNDLLALRAAIESLGPMQDPNDVLVLTPFLNHSSRDVRATTALALGDLCNNTAITALRDRLQNESIDQVRLAISSALRTLNQAPCTP